MRPRWFAPAATIALLLAGCSAPADEPAAEPNESGAEAGATARLALAVCREQIGIFPVTDAQAAPYVPDGFGLLPPLPPDLHPGADPTGQTATLLFVAFYCEEPTVSFLIPWFPAVPPQDLQVANASYHAVAGAPIVQGDVVADWLTSVGIPFSAGKVTQQPSLLPTDATMTSTMVAQAAGIDMSILGTSPRNAEATPQELLPLFITHDREVVGRLDLHIGAHTHWQFGAATASITGFLQPSGPGLSTHSEPGMAVTLVVE